MPGHGTESSEPGGLHQDRLTTECGRVLSPNAVAASHVLLNAVGAGKEPDRSHQNPLHHPASHVLHHQLVMSAATATFAFPQEAKVNQRRNVAVRRVLRTFGNGRPFRRGHLAFEPVEQAVQHLDLAFVQRQFRGALPELRLRDDRWVTRRSAS